MQTLIEYYLTFCGNKEDSRLYYVKKSVVINKYEYGGLHFFDFASLNNTFKINWLKQYLTNPYSFWNILPNIVFFLRQEVFLSYRYVITISLSYPLNCQIFINKCFWRGIWFINIILILTVILFWIMVIFFIQVNPYFSQIGSIIILLVSQLLNSDGYLYSYSEFLNKYNIPVTPREFAIVMDAIPCRALTLLKGSARSQSSLSKIHTFDTMLGKICFLLLLWTLTAARVQGHDLT